MSENIIYRNDDGIIDYSKTAILLMAKWKEFDQLQIAWYKLYTEQFPIVFSTYLEME